MARNRSSAASGKSRGLQQDIRAIERALESREHEIAAATAAAVLQRFPGNAFANKALGVVHLERGELEAARARFERALIANASDPELHTNLGVCRFRAGNFEKAIEAFRVAIRMNPAHASGHVNLSAALRALRRDAEAAAAARAGMQFMPDDPGIVGALGMALHAAGDHQQALPHLTAAASQSKVDALEILSALADSLTVLGHYPEATEILDQLVEHYEPDAGDLANLLHARLQTHDWRDLAGLTNRLQMRLSAGDRTAAPFISLSLPQLTAAQHREIAAAHAGLTLGSASLPAGVAAQIPDIEGRRLRLGYLSADLHDHATSRLLAGVIEAHDRARFEVFAYSTGPDDGSPLRSRMQAAFDVFHDLQQAADAVVAKRIRDDAIDILIDLKGWTAGHRLGVLAQRPAPIQVAWLGYPGTVGDRRCVDFLIGDPLVTPEAHAASYAETLVRMPVCYQPNDRQRAMAPPPSRTAAGLPEHGFVFCSFNQGYKINPLVLDAWCRILGAVPGSVLWLPQPRDSASRERLCRAAAAWGLDCGRLIFAPQLPVDQHLGRLALADLALDTFPVNSHTTGSDALWAGVPMVSFAGESFAGRVGASLLNAVGLPEFVGTDLADYERIAIAYAADPARQQQVRRHLVEARTRSPLFDTAQFTRDLEALLLGIVRDHAAV